MDTTPSTKMRVERTNWNDMLHSETSQAIRTQRDNEERESGRDEVMQKQEHAPAKLNVS